MTTEQADPADRAFAQWLNAVEKIVFSTTLPHADWQNARLATTDPAATVWQLRQEPGGESSCWPARASSGTCWKPAS